MKNTIRFTPKKTLLLSLFFSTCVLAQQQDVKVDSSTDLTNPLGKTREIDFTTDEGTWMSVDISPDGKWIVFDLLGHIYRIPSKGGKAVALTQNSGVAMNYHPRISPNGKEIVFVSDRAGQDNLWVINADGSNPRLVHNEMNARFAEPTWTLDGQNIIATKRGKTPSGFYRTQDEIWSYPRQGGEGKPLIQLGASGESAPARSGVWSGNNRAQWPSVSPNGEYIYFHSGTFSGGERHLRRLHLKTGNIENITESKARYWACCGRAAYPAHLFEVAPEISPNGRWLAFVRKLPGGRTSYRGKELNGRTTLWLRDLKTGEDRIIMDPISNTLAELHPSWHTRVLPGYDWANDSRSIVISQGGKIRRVWLKTGQVETIPFVAQVHRTISEQARGQVNIDDKFFEAKAIRWPAMSPDGNKLVFEAVGKLWLKSMPDGQPKPLTTAMPNAFQVTPAWSADGKWVAFATSSDTEGGHVWKVPVNGGKPIRLTKTSGIYFYPGWQESDQTLVTSRWPLALNRDNGTSNQWQLVRINASGGDPETVTAPGFPAAVTYGNNGQYWVQSDNRLMYAGNSGAVPKAIATIAGNSAEAVPSPNGKWFAVRLNQDVYITPAPKTNDAELPVVDVLASGKRLSEEGGYYPAWRDDNNLGFSSAGSYYSYNVNTGSLKKTKTDLKIERDLARGILALTNAHIITLEKRKVINRGSILIRNGRITCVGNCKLSGADRQISLQGKTVIPGWVDTHAHHTAYEGKDGLFPQHRSSSAAYLAYGITTTHDPSTDPINSFTLGEMIAAGRIIGPRTFSTGTALDCGDISTVQPIKSYQEAVNQVNRLANLGALSIKDYKQCTRLQRTWLAEAARRRGVTLTSEHSDYQYLLGLVMTGHAGFEHAINVRPTYSDLGRFMGQAQTHYSAQLSTSGDYPEGNPLEYWFSQSDLWFNKKLMRWDRWQKIASRRTYVNKPINDYGFPIQSETAADIKRNGGFGSIGAHGEQVGLGTHWEAWSYGQSMTPMEMLEAASYDGAHFLGLENEIGSVSVGKLADLIILNESPLDDIHNTANIFYVVKGGRVYDAETLDEIWPNQKNYGARPWRNDEITRSDLIPDDHWDKK